MIDEKTFNAKFYWAVDTFRDWLPTTFDFPGSRILDFGCEYGVMTLAIALRLKPQRVVGVDINALHRQLLDLVKDKIAIDHLPANLEFYQVEPVEDLSTRFQFDAIFTWSTFEHVNQPNLAHVVQALHNCLCSEGFVFLQISPLYYSALGAHLDTLVDLPWVHLLMQNNLLRHAVFSAAKNETYAQEDDENYAAIKAGIWSCYETLNKITADQVIELFEANGFTTVKQMRTDCSATPPPSLTRIFSPELLKNEGLFVLFQKTPEAP